LSAPTVSTRLAQIAEQSCGQQRIMRLGWERPGSLAVRRVLTNRMREYFTYGSVGGAGGNPGSYPAANAGERLGVVVRNSMEPFILRKANDDRRLSIGASQTRHKDCRASRPLISMAKAGIRHEGLFAAGLPNRDIPHRAMSIERLEPCEGKLSRTVLRGA